MRRRPAQWIEAFRLDWMNQVTLRVMAERRGLTLKQVLNTAQYLRLPRRPRPRKLDDGMIQVIQRGLEHGQRAAHFARLFKVSPHTIARWVAIPKKPRPLRRCPICQGREAPEHPHNHARTA